MRLYKPLLIVLTTSLLSVPSTALPQALNTLAAKYPNLRTLSTNSTYFILALPISSITPLVTPYKLLPVPISDTSLFPSGFPPNTHPVIVSTGLTHDIRMGALYIDNLMSAQILVPFTDRLGDGKTPFLYSVRSYIGGSGGKGGSGWAGLSDFLGGLIPALVATLEGTTVSAAEFLPNDAAFSTLSTTPPLYSAQIKVSILPNPLSGPSISPAAIDLLFSPQPNTYTPKYNAHTYHAMINQPLILTATALGMCQRNTIYFKESFAYPFFVTGTVVLGNGPVPNGIVGTYEGVEGYSATGEEVGFSPENCAVAARNVDAEALV